MHAFRRAYVLTCLLVVGLSRCCWLDCGALLAGVSLCAFSVFSLAPPCGGWESLAVLDWWGRPGAGLSLTDSCCRGNGLAPKLDSGDWRRFPLWGRTLGGVELAAELTDSWWEGWGFIRCAGGGAIEAWRTGCMVAGGVATEAGVPVPVAVWGAMPINTCWWRFSWMQGERNNVWI